MVCVHEGYRDINRIVEAVDKRLDRIVRDVFRGRPGKRSSVRPKKDSGLLPVDVRAKRDQGSGPLVYALPSWRDKLKGQLPDNIRETTKLHPVKRSRLACANNAKIVAGAHSGFALEGREPALKLRRKNERRSEALSRGSRKKRFGPVMVSYEMVCDNSLHERKRGQNGSVSSPKRKRLAI